MSWIAVAIGGAAGGAFLSSRSASKSARKTRKMLKALYAEEGRRRKDALNIHEQIVATYGPGGTGWKTGMGLVDRAVRKGTAGAMQGIVSAGLAGTTVKAGIAPRVEEQIGMPGREAVLGRYTSALTNQAQVVGQSPFATMSPTMIQGFGGYPGSTTGSMLSSLSDLPYMLMMVNKTKQKTTGASTTGTGGTGGTSGTSGKYPIYTPLSAQMWGS